MIDSTTTRIIESADRLYAERCNTLNVHSSVELLEPISWNSFEAAWRLGRSLFFIGQESIDIGAACRSFTRGIEICNRAINLEANRVEGHFWLGVNLALLANSESRCRALLHAVIAKRALKKAIRIDPSYHAAGPLRVMGRLRHKLPFAIGGGKLEARRSFERALAFAPNNTVTRIYFAELLLEMGERAEAKHQLNAVMNTPFDSEWEFEIKRDQRLAKEMLARMPGFNRS